VPAWQPFPTFSEIYVAGLKALDAELTRASARGALRRLSLGALDA
jgi:hypothetical protein